MSAPEGLSIRPATEADASRIASIHVRSKRTAYRAFMPADYLDSLDQDDHRLHRWQPYFAARQDENRAWIAFVRGIPAGFVALERVPHAEATPAGYLLLHHLHMAPEFRGRGIGGALLRTAVEDARRRKAPGMALWTHEENAAARAFYERAGWKTDGATHQQEHEWPGGTFTATNVRYVLALA